MLISVCQLKGHSFSVPEGDGQWSWSDGHFTYFMDHFEPVDMIGYSIYIYHITAEQAAEVRAKLEAAEREEETDRCHTIRNMRPFVVPPSGGSLRKRRTIPPEGGTTNLKSAEPAITERAKGQAARM